jgi:hypothetical protein
MTGIEAVSIDLKLSRHSQSYNAYANLLSSDIIINLSSIYRPVTARSMSLDSKANPVVKEPNNSSFGC